MTELATGAIALALITLMVAGGLCYCFCKSSSDPNQRDFPGEKKSDSCFKFGSGDSKPKFTQMRGSRKSKSSQDERAIELARFERMSNRSDAYPKFGGSATLNPISAPPGSGDKFRNLSNGGASLI